MMDFCEETLFAWRYLYRSIENSINRKSDILVAFLHYLLIKNANFRCIGIGEKVTNSDDEVGSEFLPDGWNDNDTKYTLQYVNFGDVYLLLGVISEETLIMNIVNVKKRLISNIALEPEMFVICTEGSLETMVPSIKNIFERFNKELIQPVFKPNVHEVTTQTLTKTQLENPLRISEPLRPVGQFIPENQAELRPFGFPDIARTIHFD